MLWMATGTWRQIRALNKPRAAAAPVFKLPSSLRHPIATMVSALFDLKFAPAVHRRAKSRA
jgi:hypothetical protein